MRYRKYENHYAVRIDQGEEIMAKLKELCRRPFLIFNPAVTDLYEFYRHEKME